MKVATGSSTLADADAAVEAAYARVRETLGGPPDLLLVHATSRYDPGRVAARVAALAPGVPVHGGSSCMGVMTEEGFHSHWGNGLGMLGLADPEGAYGVGAAPVGDDPRAAVVDAARQALAAADRPGEVPGLVLLTAAPGAEERLLEGIEGYFGPNVVVAGGSSADEMTAAHSYQIAGGRALRGSVVVATLFPSTEIMSSFHSGYEPTAHRGVVTRAEGRVIYEIDGRPCGDVLDEWADGMCAQWERDAGPAALMKVTMHPLGRVVGTAGGQPYYLLSHPQSVTPGRGIRLLTEFPEGEEVVLMQGTLDSLATRAGRVIQSALETTSATVDEVAGALVVYCAGCMLTMYDRMPSIATSVRDALGGRPFLGVFSFGEQGCFVGGENRHGNLMICATLFGR